jgi:hypothetical protein
MKKDSTAEPADSPLFRYAEWQRTQSWPTSPTMTLFKQGEKLIVTEFGRSCALLSVKPQKPRIRDFRVWKQPLMAVIGKLSAKGWVVGGNHASEH